MIHGAVCVRVRVQESVAKELESVVGWFDELASVELEDVDIASRAAVTEDPDSNYWLREDSPEDCAHRYGASPPIVFYLFFFFSGFSVQPGWNSMCDEGGIDQKIV